MLIAGQFLHYRAELNKFLISSGPVRPRINGQRDSPIDLRRVQAAAAAGDH